MKEKLLPCPFCGSTAKIYGYDEKYYVSCTVCVCSLGELYDRDAMPCHIFADEETAIYNWNNRTPSVQQPLPSSEQSSSPKSAKPTSGNDERCVKFLS